MRQTLLSLTLLFLSSNAAFAQKMKFENQLFDCICEKALKDDVDLKAEAKRFEAFLVQEKVIGTANGQAYVDLFNDMVQKNAIVLKLNKKWHLQKRDGSRADKMFGMYLQDRDCLEAAMQYKDGKFFKKSTMYKFVEDFEEIAASPELTPVLILSPLTNNLTAKDYKHPFYKLFSLSYLSGAIALDQGLMQQLPPPNRANDLPIVKERNILEIHLRTEQDSVWVNQTLVPMTALDALVTDFFTIQTPDGPEFTKTSIDQVGEFDVCKGVIHLKNERETAYAMYVKVQDILAKNLNQRRDKLSMDTFRKKFVDLEDKEQIRSIRAAIPSRVSEVMNEY